MGDLDTAMVDTVARDPLMLKPMPGTAVDTDMEVMVDTDTPVDMEVMAVTDTVPDTVFLDTELDTLDMEVTDSDMPVVMEVTVLDTAMVDTVARDPLKPGVYMDVAMEVMVDTAVDTVMVDTDGKHFQTNSPKKPFYTKFCHFYYCRNE